MPLKKIYKYNILIYDTIIIMLNLHTHHPPFRSSSQLLSADVSLGDLDKVPQTSEKHLTTTTRSWENHLKSMAIHKNTTGVLSLSIYIYMMYDNVCILYMCVQSKILGKPPKISKNILNITGKICCKKQLLPLRRCGENRQTHKRKSHLFPCLWGPARGHLGMDKIPSPTGMVPEHQKKYSRD